MTGTCGNCKYGRVHPQDFSKRFCGGMPPYPVAVPTAKGMMIQQIQVVRELADLACALYKPRLHLAEGSSVTQEQGGVIRPTGS